MKTTKTIKLVAPPAISPLGDYTGYASVLSIVGSEFSMDPNLRDPTLGEIQKEVVKTLQTTPANFSRHAGGILLTAQAVHFDPKTLELSLTMERGLKTRVDDGIPDGAHLYTAMKEYVVQCRKEEANREASPEDRAIATQKLGELMSAVVRFEVLVNMDDAELTDVCLHRNTSRAQKQVSVVNHRDGFAFLKQVLGADISKAVAWYDGDRAADGKKKRYDVKELVRLITATAAASPVVAYSSVNEYVKTYESKMAAADPAFVKATQHVVGLMTLASNIETAMASKIKNSPRRFNTKYCAEHGIGLRETKSGVFSNKRQPVTMPIGLLIPAVAAVARYGFNATPGTAAWDVDPTKIFEGVETALLNSVFDVFDASNTNITGFGKKSSIYEALGEVVETGRAFGKNLMRIVK